MIERKIGEVFRCATGDMVVCVKSHQEASCRGCIYAHCACAMCGHDDLSGICSARKRKDGNDVIFMKIRKTSLANDIELLERIAEEYPGKTIENIIAQLKSRLSETT